MVICHMFCRTVGQLFAENACRAYKAEHQMLCDMLMECVEAIFVGWQKHRSDVHCTMSGSIRQVAQCRA
jgi:hypothetical protein